MTDDEIIAVVTARKEGKRLQSRSRSYGDWKDMNHPLDLPIEWNFLAFDYRVKPYPREWWIYPVDRKSCAIEPTPAPGFVHVREVLEGQ